MRNLRSYRRVAHTEHYCDRCCRHIMPGDEYEGLVQSYGKNKLIVLKTHSNPACDFPWEDEESFEYQHERELDEERGLEGQLAEAA